MAQEVSAEEFAAKLGDRGAVDAALASGKGMALYSNGRGNRLAVSYGTRDADVVGLPPKLYGGGELEMFVSPQRSPASMRSPLLDYQPPPQISRPRVAPTRTEYPSVMISGRTSSHPRGNSEFITPLLPGREQSQPQEPQQQEPLSDDQRWWRTHLRGR
jgi:hypothetical protein